MVRMLPTSNWCASRSISSAKAGSAGPLSMRHAPAAYRLWAARPCALRTTAYTSSPARPRLRTTHRPTWASPTIARTLRLRGACCANRPSGCLTTIIRGSPTRR